MLTEQQKEAKATGSLSQYLSDELAKRTTEEAWLYLRQLPGVGPRTAVCVLMFNLNRPAMPVELLIWIRSISIVLLIVAHKFRRHLAERS